MESADVLSEQIVLRGVPDDRTLAVRARDGDHEAYAALVRRHQAVALRVAAVVGPVGEAEDACQDGFVKAYGALGRYDAERPFRAWLLAIVANEARTRGRQSRRVARLLQRAALLAPADGAASEELALGRIGAGPLLAGFERLRPDEQLTLALRFVLDLSEQETADLLGCPAGTVKSRTSRALSRLRVFMEEPA